MASTAEAMVSEAEKWVGYLEKKSNADLDSYTGNAGYNNYTIFGQWYGANGVYWCDEFVSYVAAHSGNDDVVGKFASCPYHVAFFAKQGRYHTRASGYVPKVGDIIFFDDGSTVSASNPYWNAGHVGIVYSVDSSNVYTIEGNTSSASGVVANGGGVAKKSYSRSYSKILGYGNPAYSNSTTPTTENSVAEGMQKYKNRAAQTIVYRTSALTEKIGSLNANEECYCFGRVGTSYLVCYKVDGTDNTWKCGYVSYNGGTTF